MITRHKQRVDDILHSESLNLHPAENQAAKIFAKWLTEHPEYSADNVDMRIDSYEREEDYFGNGGGYDKYVRIYQTREESDEEYAARIKKEEDDLFADFDKETRASVYKLIQDMGIYHCFISDEIRSKVEEITSGVNAVVRKCLKR